MKQNYVILSKGAYSDYDPIYFVGERQITQEELETKANEIGDEMWSIWGAYPTRVEPTPLAKAGYPQYAGQTHEVKYDPDNEKNYISDSGPDENEFLQKMTEWLKEQGYEQVPNDLPEINVYYDVPRSDIKN